MLGKPISRQWERYFPGDEPGRIFSVIADIESYPRFVPGCVSARIVERGQRQWIVDNHFGFGPARTRFSSVALLDPPSVLTISSDDGPWREFRVHWRFLSESGGCRLACHALLDFRSAIVATMANVAAGEIERWIVAAFDARIRSGIPGKI